MCVYLCLCVAMWAWVRLPRRPAEGIRLPKAAVTGSFELPDLSARNWLRSSTGETHFLLLSHLTSLLRASETAKYSINSCLLIEHVGIHLQCQHSGNGSRGTAEWSRPAWSTHISLHEGEAFCTCPGSVGVHVSECVHVCQSVHVCVYVHVCEYVHARVSVCACDSVHACMCVWICTCVWVCVYVRVYEYVHVCTHIQAVTPYWCEAKYAMKYNGPSREKWVCMPRIKCK